MEQKPERDFIPGSLVIYKGGAAKVIKVSDKIEIELAGKKTIQVRDKDIVFLHKGPVSSLSELKNSQTDTDKIRDACEILEGETVTLKELAELAFESFTPAGAWAVCAQLQDSLYITGSIDEIKIRSKSDVDRESASRQQKADEKSEWADFTVRVRKGDIIADDKRHMRDLELFALGKQGSSRLLKELRIQDTAENAHTLLLRLGVWDYTVNPYISRLGFTKDGSYPDHDYDSDRSNIFSGQRIDLTRLDSYAVDDEGNTDPDDAVSFEDGKLWVHIADPSSAVRHGSDADIYAMNQGANIYLPEIRIPMLSHNFTEIFGLGFAEVSPALSFCIEQNDDGSLKRCGIYFSKVKVKRITYAQAQDLISTNPFDKIFDFAMLYKKYRISRGAVSLSFPDVSIKVSDSVVTIKPYRHYDSADMIQEAMIMAGESAAKYAAERSIPFIYSAQETQESPELPETPGAGQELKVSLSSMFAKRRQMSPGVIKSQPDRHSGLGLSAYSRVTSPLRRYLDLAAHHQLRLSLSGMPLPGNDEVIAVAGAASAGAAAVQKLERISNMHWTLVYLLQNPGWEGKGIIVDKRERFDQVFIPEIGFETTIPPQKSRATDSEVTLKSTAVDLPNLKAYFNV